MNSQRIEPSAPDSFDSAGGKPKQVIVLRKDLKMRKGKMVAQGAHASFHAVWQDATRQTDGRFVLEPDEMLLRWLRDGVAKICVSVDSEAELLELHSKARSAGIRCSLITDSGKTEFHGNPTKTALALGPDLPERIDPITGHLSLL